MIVLIGIVARTSFVAAVGLIASWFLRRRSAALRHASLAMTLAAVVAVLPLTMVLPRWNPLPLHVEGLSGPQSIGLTVPEPNAATASATWLAPIESPRGAIAVAIVGVVWASGVAVFGSLLLAGISRVRRIEAGAECVRSADWALLVDTISGEYRLKRPVTLSFSEASDLLATWRLLRPRVLLPSHAREWSVERREVVLRHELAHIQRGDWVVQLGAEMVRTLFWFNPLFWVICTQLRRLSEQACDDLVLAAGVPARRYASHLLELARICRSYRSPSQAVTLMAHPSTLERRFAAMLNPRLDRRPASVGTFVGAAVLLLALCVPVAAFRPDQATPLPLSGAVYDPSGAVLPAVALTLIDAARNKWQATTDASGRFEFPTLGPGRYEMDASLPGFRRLHHIFELRNPGDWDQAITLQVGQVSEEINVTAAREPGAPAPSLPAPSQPVRIGGNIRAPTKLKNVPPIYPAAMRAAGREGVVPIEAIIGTDGAVHSVRVLSASIHPDFAVAAADAVRQWRFAPTLLNRVPVEVSMTVNIRFSLTD
jgi:TonB family protein